MIFLMWISWISFNYKQIIKGGTFKIKSNYVQLYEFRCIQLSMLPNKALFLKLTQCTLGGCAFCYSIVSSNASICTFAKDIDCHTNTTSIGQFFRFTAGRKKN